MKKYILFSGTSEIDLSQFNRDTSNNWVIKTAQLEICMLNIKGNENNPDFNYKNKLQFLCSVNWM